MAVTDEAILAAREEVALAEGLLLSPEGAATYAAWKEALADGRVSKEERAVLFNCATGLKYPLPPAERRLDIARPIDWASLAGGSASGHHLQALRKGLMACAKPAIGNSSSTALRP
jgi:threonine synthase